MVQMSENFGGRSDSARDPGGKSNPLNQRVVSFVRPETMTFPKLKSKRKNQRNQKLKLQKCKVLQLSLLTNFAQSKGFPVAYIERGYYCALIERAQ